MLFLVLLEWLSFPRLSPGQRALLFKKVSAAAALLGNTRLIELCAQGVAMEDALVAMRRKLESAKNKKADPRLLDLDGKIDHLIGSIFRALNDDAQDFEGEARGDAAQRILAKCFPKGAFKITTLSYPDQCSVVNSIIKDFDEIFTAELELTRQRARAAKIKALNPTFSNILAELEAKEITYSDFKDANNKSQAFLLRVLLLILNTYADESEDKSDELNSLLAPFYDTMKEQKQKNIKARKAGSKKSAVEKHESSEEVSEENTDSAEPEPEHSPNSHSHNINLTME